MKVRGRARSLNSMRIFKRYTLFDRTERPAAPSPRPAWKGCCVSVINTEEAT